MSRVFSGIQPNGRITLGNYLGAMRQFVTYQETDDCYFCVANQNAITVAQDPKTLRQHTRNLAAMHLAVGLDPAKVTLFIQSEVAEHARLAWIMLTLSNVGELEGMAQFKEKAERYGKPVPAGLLAYPPFMAADILLYQTDLVPVGEDQKENIDYTRQLAHCFNTRFGDVFTVPEMRTLSGGARIGSLQDPTKKMSKSDSNPKGSIFLLDEPDTIIDKINSAQTDSDKGISFDEKYKPGLSNLMSIYSLLTDDSLEDVEMRYAGKDPVRFKTDLAEVIVGSLRPVQESYKHIIESAYLDNVLTVGAQKAATVASKTIEKVESAMGLARYE